MAECDAGPRAQPSRLLVSLTTVPSRVDLVERVVHALSTQSRVPDRILVVAPRGMKAWRKMWRDASNETRMAQVVHEQQEQERAARARLLQLSNRSRVEWLMPLTVLQPTVDHGPVMKLLGALQYLSYRTPAERDATLIMTVDDDTVYPPWACERMHSWADRCPGAVVAYAGAHYAGMPSRVEDFARGQKFLDGHTLGAYPGGKHRQGAPCTLRQVNYLLGWAGVGYRASFFRREFMGEEHLAWLTQDVGCESGCKASSAWLDDQYISGHLNKEGVPIYLLPFPQHRWRMLATGSAARSSKNQTHLALQTAWMLRHFAGTGDAAWSLPIATKCTADCAALEPADQLRLCRGGNASHGSARASWADAKPKAKPKQA